MDSRHVNVTYEVIIGIHIVITKYKSELPEIIWDRICDIMSAIVDNIEYYGKWIKGNFKINLHIYDFY